MSRPPRMFWLMALGALLLGVGVRFVVSSIDDGAPGADAASRSETPAEGEISADDAGPPPERPTPGTTAVYGGAGTWIDAFDFSPSYQSDGGPPPLTPEIVAELDALGIATIYLQAARKDDRAPGVLLEHELLGRFLVEAHRRGISVVGWYLPHFDDVDADLGHLRAIRDFTYEGERFDGLAVDIEFTGAVPDAGERSRRLVDLSARLRAEADSTVLAAIVPPAAQLEVVNPDFWPAFPWRELVGHYDVWMPMAYWTERRADSRYRDPYVYVEESTRRMRANLGSDAAVVHPIGGIGTTMSLEDLAGFRRALVETGAIGGSVYDWNSLAMPLRASMSESVPSS